LPQWGLLTWNRLLRLRQQVRASQQQVAIELTQRANLVPNLVAVVRAAATHEQDLLAGLTAIRSGADFAAGVRGEGAAVQTSRQVLALHERYPQLRADAVYRDLHQRLWTIEEKLAHARTAYNDIVTEWNDRLQTFPSSLVAALARHHAAPLFAVEAGEQLPPRLTL
jgi:LemA protein